MVCKALGEVFTAFDYRCFLEAVVHVVFNRVHGLTEAGDFAHLQFNVGVQHRVGEHAALGQERAVLVQVVQRLVQAVTHGRDLGIFLGRQMVQVLGGGFARVDLVFHAVQAGHHQGREGQVGVGQRIREARFDAAALGVGNVRNADRGRAVLGRVGQLDRGFKAGDQTLVAVGARVGDGVQRASVLDDAADVVQGKVGQTCIAVAGKQVLAVFPDRLVHVHAGAVVANQGLGHEGGGLAVSVGHVVHHVLQQDGPVSALHQGAELGAQLVLAGARHFVVEHFDRDAQGFQDQRHFRAHVLRAVDRGHGEVAALDGGTVATVAAFELGAGVPGGFVFVDFEERARHVVGPTHAVKNEELGFRTEEGCIAQAGRLQVGFAALGDGAGVAVVGLAVGRVQHVAAHEQRSLFVEGVDVRGVRIGHEQHVRSFNALPASDGRTIKGVAGAEFVFIKVRNRHGHVLLFAAGVREAEVNKFDFVLFHHFHDVGDGLCHQILLVGWLG